MMSSCTVDSEGRKLAAELLLALAIQRGSPRYNLAFNAHVFLALEQI